MSKLSFNGKNTVEGKILDLPNSDYSIEIILIDKDTRPIFDLSDLTPPMPLNIGGWTILKKEVDSYFIFNTGNKVGTQINFKKNEPVKIKIVCEKNLDRTMFYMNDKLHSVKKSYIKLNGYYRLGFGVLKRKWIGKIKLVKVKDLENGNLILDISKKGIDPSLNEKVPLELPKLSTDIRFHSSKETCQDRWVIEKMAGKRNGFFIDIGASDGISANNTLSLEKYYGWKGILIEGNRFSFDKLVKNRPQQICLNEIISDREQNIIYRENNEVITRSGINDTLPPDNTEKSWRKGDKVLRVSKVLTNVLEEHNCPRSIDFLSIDIEGGEINALKNFDFDKFKISLISAEVGFNNISEFREIMIRNGFNEVKNPHCSATYEYFFINNDFL